MEEFELTTPLPPVHSRAAADLPEDVLRHLGRLKASRPARRLADALLSGSPLPVDCIQSVARSLTEPSRNGWRENLVSVWASARSASAADRHAAAGWLAHVLEFWPSMDGWPRLKRSYKRTVVGMYAMVIAGAGIHAGSIIGPVFASLPACLLVYPFSAWLDRSRLNRVRAEAARGMGILAVPHSAATLAGGIMDGDERVRAACREALLQVLPTVTDDQYGRLPLDTTPRLCALLTRSDETLVLLSLRALRAVGDSRALDHVIKFLNRWQGPSTNAEIPIEAQRTFEVLFARRKREIDSASLLRPTENPAQADQALLRAYDHAGDHPAENLLRATSDE